MNTTSKFVYIRYLLCVRNTTIKTMTVVACRNIALFRTVSFFIYTALSYGTSHGCTGWRQSQVWEFCSGGETTSSELAPGKGKVGGKCHDGEPARFCRAVVFSVGLLQNFIWSVCSTLFTKTLLTFMVVIMEQCIIAYQTAIHKIWPNKTACLITYLRR